MTPRDDLTGFWSEADSGDGAMTSTGELGTLDTRSTGSAVTELLRAAIIEGRFKPGQRLRESDLARELGISRTPVREALWTLGVEGLVELLPRRGARVRLYTTGDIRERYEVRALVESYAARQASQRMTAETLGGLRESCDRFEQLDPQRDVTPLVKENLFFHATIWAASRNRELAAVAERLIELPLVYKHFFWSSPVQKLRSDREHRAVLHALEERSGARAEKVMKMHILNGAEALGAQCLAHQANHDWSRSSTVHPSGRAPAAAAALTDPRRR